MDMILPDVIQLPISDITKSDWDVIIAGAGPAGGAAAASLASCGASVLLVDRAKFPREKICGDALVPEAMAALDRIGLREIVSAHAITLPGYTMVSPSGATVDLKSPVTLLQRRALDSLISAKAVSNGAVFVHGQFQNAERLPDGDMECTFGDRKLRSKILIAAPGADVSSLRSLGFAFQFSKPEGVAIRRYYRSSGGPARPYFFLKEAFLPGYAWIFPLGDNYYNVGCGTFLTQSKKMDASLMKAFEEFLEEDPVARKLVTQSSEMTPVRGASLRCGLPSTQHALQGRIMLAGEAIGTTITGWGEGVSKAMETGLLAAEVAQSALAAKDFNKLQDYPKRLAAEIKPDIDRHSRVTSLFNRTWTANLLVNVAKFAPGNWL